ncbi:hypothetical protein CS542_09960 [Pedobacter sp. IW39]|nr:hypothetical protein CS542_09960 [Pedobacter sp. IW39]
MLSCWLKEVQTFLLLQAGMSPIWYAVAHNQKKPLNYLLKWTDSTMPDHLIKQMGRILTWTGRVQETVLDSNFNLNNEVCSGESFN